MRLGDAGGKVLIVAIDDGWFGVHLDWVEDVLQAGAASLHGVRNGSGRARPFVLRGRAPAPVVDLREMLGLLDLLGAPPPRSGQLLLRCGDGALAMPIDACIGVRALDLAARPPVPTRLRRDGGLPLGHMTALDGRPLTVLDPNRLLDAELRATLAPLRAKAAALHERRQRLATLWEEIRRDANVDQLRVYARLCARSGEGRTAGAARRVLEHLEAPAGEILNGGSDPLDRLLRELVERQRSGASGAIEVEAADGAGGTIVLQGGRVVNATCGAADGRAAFARLLGATRATRFSAAADAAGPPRITESTIALTVAALVALPERPC
ncbi:MAG: chemotaxis protein CheW [bacterium]